MKRAFWTLVVIAVSAWFVTSSIDSRRARDAEQAESQKKTEAVKASIVALTSRHKANSDWIEELSGGEWYRAMPVLTIELEELWIEKGPILYVGAINDIASDGDDKYSVTFERSLSSGLDYLFSTELRLKLTSDKGLIDRFLNNHPNLFEDLDGFNDGIAVIATVRAIQSHQYAGQDGELIEAKTGYGQIVEILYVGNLLY